MCNPISLGDARNNQSNSQAAMRRVENSPTYRQEIDLSMKKIPGLVIFARKKIPCKKSIIY